MSLEKRYRDKEWEICKCRCHIDEKAGHFEKCCWPCNHCGKNIVKGQMMFHIRHKCEAWRSPNKKEDPDKKEPKEN